MKKAQVLSALALAFALGVVAPIASTTSTVSAFTVEDLKADPIVRGAASKAEVTNAVAAVRANTTYKNMVNLEKVSKDYATPEVDVNNVKTNYEAIMNALYAADNSLNTFNADLAAKITNKEYTYASAIGEQGAKASSIKGYNLVKKLEAAKDADNSAEYSRIVLNELNPLLPAGQKLNIVDQNNSITELGSDVANAFNNYVVNISGVDSYGARKTLYNAIDDAAEPVAKYNKGLKALTDALNASGVLTTAGRDNLNNAQLKTVGGASLAALASFVSYPNLLNNYAAWMEVEDAAETAENEASDGDTAVNYDNVIELARVYGVATKLGSSKTTQQIAQDLVNYKGSAGTGEGENKPGDDNKDPNAPDTGILADGEANASTTVAMVAGIATALTAAGAGVVAYRNARRSTRK